MRLENWFPIYLGANLRLIGKSYGDTRRPDGREVVTSAIVAANGMVVATKSGSQYQLGTPAENIADIFSRNRLNYHAAAPFGFLPTPEQLQRRANDPSIGIR